MVLSAMEKQAEAWQVDTPPANPTENIPNDPEKEIRKLKGKIRRMNVFYQALMHQAAERKSELDSMRRRVHFLEESIMPINHVESKQRGRSAKVGLTAGDIEKMLKTGELEALIKKLAGAE